jgi:hypothetical protein
LWAGQNKVLTKDHKNYVRTVIVSESEINDWIEIDDNEAKINY